MNRNGNNRSSPLRRDLVALTLAAAAAAITINANAASDIFAKIGDIKGESPDDKHKDQIEVLSWSWGVTGAQRKTPLCPHEFTINKSLDRSTPPLISATAQGTVFPQASVSVRKAGSLEEDYLTITLTNAVITSYDSKMVVTLDKVSEMWTLAYATATISYKLQQPDGSFGAPITATVGPSCPPP